MSRINRWDLALDAFGGDGAMAAALALQFKAVHPVDPDLLKQLPYADASASCIVTRCEAGVGPASSRRGDTLPALVRTASECRRVLQPGGCLYVGIDNAWWSPRLMSRIVRAAPVGAPHLGEVTRILEASGFAEVNAYYAQPSLGDPRSLIPVTGAAPAVHESIQQTRTGMAALRPALAASPLRRLLYPSLICLAYP